jgi:predicted KAP-like P-loop ATPase
MSYADNPISTLEQEWLSRESSVDTLVDVLSAQSLETPLVVGIHGAWGSGKTSVMNLLKAGLPKDHLSLWFDAWKYARQDIALWRALLLAVVEALGHKEEGLPRLLASEEDGKELQDKLDELATSLYRSQTIAEKGNWRVNWGAAVPFAVDLGLSAATAGLWDKLGEATGAKAKLKELAAFFADKETKDAMQVIEREQATRYREQVSSLEQFQKELRKLIGTHIVELGRRLYVFVDDLDRCLPEDAVGALEALKLFLDLPGCVFILGMDRHVVEQGIRVRYKEFELAGGLIGPVDPRQYLDKIIQIPFRLPPLSNRQMADFVGRWCTYFKENSLEEFAALISTGGAPNPRSVKRTLNMLRLISC